MKTIGSCVVVCLIVFLFIRFATDDFTAFTQERARQIYVANNRPVIGNFMLLNDSGNTIFLRDLIRRKHQYALVNFIYTRCNFVCSLQGSDFEKLQNQIITTNKIGKVWLLSISFDPRNDTPKVLKDYGKRMKSLDNLWVFSTVKEERSLKSVLDFFGIKVIKDELGQFQHNAAILVINPEGHFQQVIEYQDADKDQQIRQLLEEL